MTTRLTGATIVLPDRLLPSGSLVIEDGRISALLPDAAPQLGHAAEQVDLGGGWLLPGFIDVQVNGGGGALFLGGAVAQVMALGSAAEVARLREAGSPSPDQAAKLRAALDRNATEQTLALVGMGLGAVSAGVGAYLFFTNPDLPAGTSVAVLPGGEGASFVLSGTF